MPESATDQSECTDKLCDSDATYALWMSDHFSRVMDPHESMPYDGGDLHPYVCEDCLHRYERIHGDKGEFIRPVEKIAADGGLSSSDTAESVRWRYAIDDAAAFETRHEAVGEAAIINRRREDCRRDVEVWAYPECACETSVVTLDHGHCCGRCGAVIA